MSDTRRRRLVGTRGVVLAIVVAGLSAGLGSTASAAGRQLWVQRYDDPGHGDDLARFVAVSPDGSKVYVTGQTFDGPNDQDYGTAAYDTSTGAQLWGERYDGPGHSGDIPRSVTASPDGSKVFVTGESWGSDALGQDFTTVAYDAATGAQLWVDRYNGPSSSHDEGKSVVVSPDGSTVFATGLSYDNSTYYDYVTIAYSSSTGAELWVQRYNDGTGGQDLASALTVSPDGSKVLVTGEAEGPDLFSHYGTVAYDAATGTQLWGEAYKGPAGSDFPYSIAASPGGSMVYVTGWSDGAGSSIDYATVAYSTSTGAQLWVRRYNGPGNSEDLAFSAAVSSGGGLVFVTGFSPGSNGDMDFATVAYDAATGAGRWLRRYDGPAGGYDGGFSVAVSPGGSKVFVSGLVSRADGSTDIATVAYGASSGTMLWVNRYNGPAGGDDLAYSVAVAPGGSRVFVTGTSGGSNGDFDWATVAYVA